MRCIEVIGTNKTETNEAEPVDAQLQSLKQQEKMIKKRKAQLKVNSAIKRYNAIK